MAKCNQLLPIMKDPIGHCARQSNSQTEGERQLCPKCAFEKPETPEAIGVSCNELKLPRRVVNRKNRSQSNCRHSQRKPR